MNANSLTNGHLWGSFHISNTFFVWSCMSCLEYMVQFGRNDSALFGPVCFALPRFFIVWYELAFSCVNLDTQFISLYRKMSTLKHLSLLFHKDEVSKCIIYLICFFTPTLITITKMIYSVQTIWCKYIRRATKTFREENGRGLGVLNNQKFQKILQSSRLYSSRT